MDSAIEKLKIIFLDVPVGRPAGSDNEKSTYRHLIICRLEFLALSELLGEDKAKEVTLNNKSYKWIRRIILEHGSEIDQIIKQYFPASL